jgi:DNA recombination protein RmuC
METLIAFVLGTLFGSLLLFFMNRGREQNFRREIETLKSTHEQTLIQQKQLLEERIRDHELSAQKLKDQFSLVAQEILNQNLETQKKALQEENHHQLDKKKIEFNQSFEEIKTSLKATTDQIQNFEKERTHHYASLQKQIETISQQEVKLIQETERLKSALTTSQSVRGRWGELVLKNILSQSDLVSGIDFEEQGTTSGNDGNTLKPDFVIRLPQSGQHLVIDSKASIFDSYLESETVETESSRRALHVDFAKRLRTRIVDLSSKEYQKHVNDSLPYVVLFVPSEAAIRAAFDVDQELFRWAMDRKVFLASPATILPLIMLIAHGWKQFRLSERALELSQAVSQLGDRIETFVKRLSRVQSGLDQATRAWNEAIDKSWYGNQSVQKSIEKARELGGNLSAESSLAPLEHTVRGLETQS